MAEPHSFGISQDLRSRRPELEWLDDERLRLTSSPVVAFGSPRRARQSSVVLGRVQLLRRLLWLVAPPRQHQVRYVGVLAPAAKLRPRVTPDGRIAVQVVWSQHRGYEPAVPLRRRVSWAELLAKTYDREDVGGAGEGRKPKPADVYGRACPRCEGPMCAVELNLLPKTEAVLEEAGLVELHPKPGPPAPQGRQLVLPLAG